MSDSMDAFKHGQALGHRDEAEKFAQMLRNAQRYGMSLDNLATAVAKRRKHLAKRLALAARSEGRKDGGA